MEKAKHVLDYTSIKEIKPGEIVIQTFPDDPTDTYFSIAFRTMKECGNGPNLVGKFEQDILTSCIFSFLSLESSINRLFYETFVRSDKSKIQIKKEIPQSIISYLRQSWQRLSVRDKFILLPPLSSEYEYDTKSVPFNLFSEFVTFRNLLVHPKMLTIANTVKVTTSDETSFGGELMNQSLDNSLNKTKFNLTNFATSFNKLTVNDAEKAFEIAYRMRMELAMNVNMGLIPILRSDFSENTKMKFGEGIADTIKLQFGPLPSQNGDVKS
ncbi:MAG: hypothetical protein GQ533_02425 [Methanosarcinaceae archaeon]|nr:hypothetical protein [Methanosarcinaceae archaeon]